MTQPVKVSAVKLDALSLISKSHTMEGDAPTNWRWKEKLPQIVLLPTCIVHLHICTMCLDTSCFEHLGGKGRKIRSSRVSHSTKRSEDTVRKNRENCYMLLKSFPEAEAGAGRYQWVRGQPEVSNEILSKKAKTKTGKGKNWTGPGTQEMHKHTRRQDHQFFFFNVPEL